MEFIQKKSDNILQPDENISGTNFLNALNKY